MGEIIKQKKSDEDLTKYTEKIIDLLHDLNHAETHKVLSCLLSSFEETIKAEGMIVIKEEEEQEGD